MAATPDDVQEWLDRFAAAVRARDLEAGRALFTNQALGYGTRAASADGLDALVATQWSPVWAATTGFAFAPADRLVAGAEHAVVAVRWTSSAASGAPRSGRATLVLQTGPDDRLQCTHSHFSLDPTDGGRLT